MNEVKKDNFIVLIFKYSISSWVNLLLGFVFTIISTRVLEPGVYGKISLFTNSANTLMYIVTIGLDSSYMRFYHETPHGEKRNVFVFKLMMVSSIIMVGLFLGVAVFCHNWFSRKMFNEASWFLTLMLFGMIFSNLILRFLNITYRMAYNTKMYTIQNVLVQSATKILIILGAIIRPDHYTVLFVQVIGFLILTFVYGYIQRRDILPVPFKENSAGLWDFSGYRTIFKYAIFCAPVYIITNLNVVAIQQIIRDKISEASLGVYSSANFFSSLFAALQTGFSTFWAAYMFENFDSEKKRIRDMTNYICLFGILMLSGFVIFRRLIYLFIGTSYHESIHFFSLLVAPKIFGFVSQATIYGINISKKTYIDAIFISLYCVADIALSYLFAARGGIMAIAYIGLITFFIYFVMDTIFGQKYYKTIADTGKFIWSVAAILAIALIPAIISKNLFITLSTIAILLISMFIFRNELIFMIGKFKGILYSKRRKS